MSALISAQPPTCHSAVVISQKLVSVRALIYLLILSPASLSPDHLFHRDPLCFFTCSLSFCHISAALSQVPFLLSLLLLSSFSHAPVGEDNAMAMAGLWCGVFVCVMSHYSSSIVALSFFFLIPLLMDHSAILRFYKPFQRSFKGKACPCTVYHTWVFLCERFDV